MCSAGYKAKKKYSMKFIQFAPALLIFSHIVGWEIAASYLLICIVYTFLFRLKLNSINSDRLQNYAINVAALFLCIKLMQSYLEDAALNFFQIQQYLSIYILYLAFNLMRPWNFEYIKKISKFLFAICLYTIIIEFILINIIGLSKEIIPTVRYSPYYFEDFMGIHRPFGLTGQTSVNAGLLLLAFLLLTETTKFKVHALVKTIFGTILSISGQGVISLFIVLILMAIKKIKNMNKKIVYSIVLSSLFFYILSLNINQKISLDYLIYIFLNKIYLIETIDALDYSEIAFGMSNYEVNNNITNFSEVYIVDSIMRVGVIFTIFFWVFIWKIVRKSKNKYIWFFAVFISSLHYPTILYIEAQIILLFLFFYTNNSKSAVEIHTNHAN